MEILKSAFLGLVQGVAEFLPISSSGHLSLFQNLLGMGDLAAMEENALFNILLHLATLVAVCIAYWGDIRDMIVELWRLATGGKKRGLEPNRPMRRQIGLMIVATLPLAIVLPIHSEIETLGAYPWLVGIALVVTGTLLFVSDRMPRGSKTAEDMTVWDALVVGLCQAVATVPGISRSGATITAGMSRKLDRPYAVKFSFLISLVSVTGAVLLKALDVIRGEADLSRLPVYLVGMAVSGVVGYACIKLLQKIVSKGKFGGFAYYCWAVGILSVVLSLI